MHPIDRVLIEQALEALTYIYTETTADEDALIHAAIDALRDRLEQPETVIDKSAAIRIATALGWEPRKGTSMKPKLIQLLEQCIETGIQRGWDRAFKHDDNPPTDTVRERIREAIWCELHEWFDFDGTEPQPLFDDWGSFPYKGNK